MALVFRKDKRKDMQHEDPQLSARHRTALRQSKRKQKQNEWQRWPSGDSALREKIDKIWGQYFKQFQATISLK